LSLAAFPSSMPPRAPRFTLHTCLSLPPALLRYAGLPVNLLAGVGTVTPNLAVNRTPIGGEGYGERLVGAGYLTR